MLTLKNVLRKTCTTATALVLSIGASSGATSQSSRGAPAGTRDADGQALFQSYCSSCHGRNGRGDGPVADGLTVRPTDLTLLAKATDGALIAESIRRAIDGRDRTIKAHGSMEMPIWGEAFKRRDGLSEAAVKARIDAIVQYLQSIQQRRS